jgi:error-prone DNA polymerase
VNGITEPPDIDVDFEHNRREEVLDYMYANYAREHAAITGVTQCFHAPTAVQDAMRALGYPATEAFEISKRVHGGDPSGCVAELPMIAEARGVDIVADAADGSRRCPTAARLRSTHVGGFMLSAQPWGITRRADTMGRTIAVRQDDLDMIGVPKLDWGRRWR